MFHEPIIGDNIGIDDGLDGPGGGGVILPPDEDPPPIIDYTPPVIDNLTINPASINLSSQNPSATVTITANIFDLESLLTNVNLDGLGANSINVSTYTWIKTYYFSSFSSGTHTQSLNLTVLNSNGMISSDSINLTIIVEPDKPKDFEPPQINSFTVNDNTVTLNNTQTTQTVTFTANITDNVNVYLYNVSDSTFDRREGDNYFFTKTFSFSDYDFGDTTNTFTAVAADDFGNVATKSLNIIITKIDTQAPTINSFISNVNSVALTTGSQSASVTFTATVSDNVGISSVDLPGTSLVFTYNNSYTFSKTYYYNSYSLGSHTDPLTITVTDTNGNTTSSSTNIAVTKTDTQSPVISSFLADDTTVTLNTSNSQTQIVTLTVQVTDNHGINSVSLPGTTSQGSSGNAYTFTKLFSQEHFSYGNTLQTFTVTVIDNAGNSSNATETITISKTDTSGPNISTFSSSSNDFALTTSLKTRLVTFTVVVNDNVAVKSITVSGATPLESGGGGGDLPPPSDGPGDEIIIDENKIVNDQIQLESNDTTPGTSNTFYFVKTYNYDNYSFGSNTDNVIVTVTDLYNNVVTAGLDINFTKIDTQAPTISSFSSNVSTLTWYSSGSSSNKTATFTAIVSDNVSVASVSINGGTQTNVSGGIYTFTKSFSSPTLNNSVNNNITLTVTDSAGITSTDSLSITTTHTDNTPPTISSFLASDTNISLNSSANSSQTVTFSANVSDNVGVNSVSITPSITLSSVIGGNYVWSKLYDADHFSFGTVGQTFTISVTDVEGNISTDTETVTITKSDSTGPAISSFTSTSTAVVVSTSSQTTTVTFTVIVADNVAVETITVSGAIPIADIPGNDDDEIIIDDNRIVDQIIQLQPGDTTPGTSNTFRFRKIYNYTNYNYGSNADNVIATVTDTVGNSSSANLNVTITKIDNMAPIISSFNADNPVINITSEGSTSAQTVTFTAIVSDNVSIDSVSLPNTSLVSSSGSIHTYSKLFDSDNYSFGTTTEIFTFSATDVNSNHSSSSVALSIVKDDNTGPVISAFLPNVSSITVSSLSKTEIIIFTIVVADNVFVKTITVSGATPIIDVPDEDDDEIIIDENKIIEQTIQLAPGDTTAGTFNTFRFQKIYNYDNYNYGQNEDNVVCNVTDYIGNTSSSETIIIINKVDNAPPTIVSLTSDAPLLNLSNSNNTETVTYTAVITDNVALSTISFPGTSLQGNTGSTYTFTKTYNVNDFNIGNNIDELTLTVTDTANNVSSKSISLYIVKSDDSGPVISNLVANPSTVNLTTSSQTKTVAITATVTDNIALSAVLLSGASFINVTNGNYLWTKTFKYEDYDFGSVKETLTLTAIDTNNNTTTQNIELDIVKGDDLAPTISSFTSSKSIVNLYSTVKTVLVYFYVTATDNVSVSGVSINGATFISQNNSVYTFQKSFNYVNYNYGETINSITAVATDSDGNTSSTPINITVNKYDNEDPVITSLTTNSNSVILNTSNPTQNLQISVVCSDNQSIQSVTVSNAVQTLVSGNTYIFQKTYNLQDYNIGIFTDTFNVLVTDPGGNVVSDSISVNVDKQDEIPPVISSFFSDITNVVLTQNDDNATISFTITATDNFLIDTISIPGANFISQSGNDFLFQKVYNYITTTEAETIDPITVTVRDTYDNVTDDTVNIIIEKIVYNYTIQDNIPFYIEANVNLNDNVSIVNGNTGINGGIIRHTNTHYNINYKLPTGNTTITMMNFDAKQGTTLLNTYNLDVLVSVDNTGTLSTTHEVTGTDTIGYIQDTADMVNYAYWDVEQPPVLNIDHADNLSSTLTPAKIESGKAAAINSVLATYQGVSVLESWTIHLSPIMPSLSNFINQYRLAKNRPIGGVFENGEQVVLSTTQDYSVIIQGIDGSSHTLVTPTTIKAIITHQDSAPELERV
jgi:hypothetical protein